MFGADDLSAGPVPTIFVVLAGLIGLAATHEAGAAENELPIHKIRLPPGFRLEVFATGVKNARQITQSPGGVLFVGSREE